MLKFYIKYYKKELIIAGSAVALDLLTLFLFSKPLFSLFIALQFYAVIIYYFHEPDSKKSTSFFELLYQEHKINLLIKFTALIARNNPANIDLIETNLSKLIESNTNKKFISYKIHYFRTLMNPKFNLKLDYNSIKKTESNQKVKLINRLIRLFIEDDKIDKKIEEEIRNISIKIKLPIVTYSKILDSLITPEEPKYEYTKTLVESKINKKQIALSILQLDENVDEEIIKRKYYQLVKIHHPDRLFHVSDEEREYHIQKFREITEAYEILIS